jgi:hypothetical protein
MSKNCPLLETQAEQLLNELCFIIKEKWSLLNLKGNRFIENIINCYNDLFDEDEDGGENEKSDDKESDQDEKRFKKLNYKKLAILNDCNEQHQKLVDEILKNFELYQIRLQTIRQNLLNLTGMKLSIFTQSMDDSESSLIVNTFKQDLKLICDSYEKELAFKKHLVQNCLFKSRFNKQDQVVIMSAWLQEPFLNDFLVHKFISFIKFHFLNK